MFFSEGRGYTRYRTYHVKNYRQNQFVEIGGGFRYLFWNSFLFGTEVGFQKIFHTKYDRTQDDDYTFYRNNNVSYSQTFYSTNLK
jgi:hypothetical protein